MLSTAALAATSYLGIRKLTNSTAWTERHTLALIGGALVAHSVGGLVIMAHTTVDRIGLIVIVAITCAALGILDRRLAARCG